MPNSKDILGSSHPSKTSLEELYSLFMEDPCFRRLPGVHDYTSADRKIFGIIAQPDDFLFLCSDSVSFCRCDARLSVEAGKCPRLS
jgi:hypothetical protein